MTLDVVRTLTVCYRRLQQRKDVSEHIILLSRIITPNDNDQFLGLIPEHFRRGFIEYIQKTGICQHIEPSSSNKPTTKHKLQKVGS